MKRTALIILMAGLATIGSGSVGAPPAHNSLVRCPATGNSREPFYGVTATQARNGPLVVTGEYRISENNRRLTLTKTGMKDDVLSLKLGSAAGTRNRAGGCLRFDGSFRVTPVKQVQITDWRSRKVKVDVTQR